MRKLKIAVLAGIFTVFCTVTALAGQWRQDAKGWWWDNGNGTYPANTWQWCDGNNDGSAECYYFDANGYCLLNTTTPDGYQVDANGAWIENGVVKTQKTAVLQPSNTVAEDDPYEQALQEYVEYCDSRMSGSENLSMRYEDKVIYTDAVITGVKSTDALYEVTVKYVKKTFSDVSEHQKIANLAAGVANRPVKYVFSVLSEDGAVMFQRVLTGTKSVK